MSLLAVLEFGDNNIKRYSKQYLVSDCRFVFSKPHNGVQPNGELRCERIEVVVVAPGKNDLNLVEWFSSQGIENGRILISLAADSQNSADDSHVLYFNDAQCFSLSECYDINVQSRRLLKMGITAKNIVIDEVQYNK